MFNNKSIPAYLTPENLKEYLFKIFENKNINIDIDNSGNVIIHKTGKGKKIAVAVPINTEELYVTHCENDKVYFNLKDNTNKESIIDLCVVSKNGVIGVVKKDETLEFIEAFDKLECKTGDVFQILSSTNCKANKLYGQNIRIDISLKIVYNTLNYIDKSDKDIYFTLYFNDNAVKSFISSRNFDYIFTLKYGIAENDFKISEGCGIVYKDGNAVMSRDILEICNNISADISNQPYFSTDRSIIDNFVILAKDAKLGSLCMPIKYMGSKCEIADMDDINSTIEILKNIIEEVR